MSESSLRDVSRFVYEFIKPQIYPMIQEEVLDDRHVIKIEFHGEDYPYSAAGRYYLRTADEDREVTPAELWQFFIANEYKEKWEKTKSQCLAMQSRSIKLPYRYFAKRRFQQDVWWMGGIPYKRC